MSDPIVATNLDTPLMIAARNGNVDALSELIDFGVPVDAVDKDNRTAFIHAAIRGEFDTAKRLLKAGADINARDNEGRTAVHYTVLGRSSGRSRRFLQQLLVKNGANLSVCDASGFTPLMLCAKSGYFKLISHGRPDLAEILIKSGVDVNFRNAAGLTALLVGAADGNKVVIMLLRMASSMMEKRALNQVAAEAFASAVRDPDAKPPPQRIKL